MNPAIPTVISMLQLDSIGITDSNIHMISEARARLVECQALVAIAEGREWPVTARLMPLARAIDDSIKDVVKLNELPFDEDEHVIDRILRKEACQASLDQVRIAAVVLMTHLGRALQSALQAQVDYPVTDSTAG